jgi:hypothetical protein
LACGNSLVALTGADFAGVVAANEQQHIPGPARETNAKQKVVTIRIMSAFYHTVRTRKYQSDCGFAREPVGAGRRVVVSMPAGPVAVTTIAGFFGLSCR